MKKIIFVATVIGIGLFFTGKVLANTNNVTKWKFNYYGDKYIQIGKSNVFSEIVYEEEGVYRCFVSDTFGRSGGGISCILLEKY